MWDGYQVVQQVKGRTSLGNSRCDSSLLRFLSPELIHVQQTLKPDDPFRIAMTDQLLDKLYNCGILTTTKSLQKAEEITASSLCRRRLPIVMVRMKMAQTPKLAITFVEQGQVRVGPNVVTDPAFLVSRGMEDFVTWVDSSKVKRTVQKYNDKLDDFDMM